MVGSPLSIESSETFRWNVSLRWVNSVLIAFVDKFGITIDFLDGQNVFFFP